MSGKEEHEVEKDDGSEEQLEMEEQSESDALEIPDERKGKETEREAEELDESESIGNLDNRKLGGIGGGCF